MLAETLWRQLGFPHRGDDDVAFSPCDVDALRSADDLVRMGVLSEGSQAALVRTWGRSYARLAEWQSTLLAELAVEGDDPEVRLAELATTVLPSVESLQSYVWRRHLASAATHLVRDAAVHDQGEAELTVCFIDIVGYTAQSRGLEGRSWSPGSSTSSRRPPSWSSTTVGRSSRPSATRSSSRSVVPRPRSRSPWR